MNDKKFIGAWVSKEQKEEIVKLAKAQNISVSNLIRQNVIRPTMTLPDVAQSVKLHIDNKFTNLENEMKKQLFNREPMRRTIIEEYMPIERLRPPPKVIEMTPQQLEVKGEMVEVMKQMKKIMSGEEELILYEVQEEELTERPKADRLSYIEFKEAAMKREPLFQIV